MHILHLFGNICVVVFVLVIKTNIEIHYSIHYSVILKCTKNQIIIQIESFNHSKTSAGLKTLCVCDDPGMFENHCLFGNSPCYLLYYTLQSYRQPVVSPTDELSTLCPKNKFCGLLCWCRGIWSSYIFLNKNLFALMEAMSSIWSYFITSVFLPKYWMFLMNAQVCNAHLVQFLFNSFTANSENPFSTEGNLRVIKGISMGMAT